MVIPVRLWLCEKLVSNLGQGPSLLSCREKAIGFVLYSNTQNGWVTSFPGPKHGISTMHFSHIPAETLIPDFSQLQSAGSMDVAGLSRFSPSY